MSNQEKLIAISDLVGMMIGETLTRGAGTIERHVPTASQDDISKGTVVALRLIADMLEALIGLPADLDTCEAVTRKVFDQNRPFHLMEMDREGRMQ